MNKHQKIIIKALIAILLLVCMLDMPYAYYQFMRIAVCGLFTWLAYILYHENYTILAVTCIAPVIVFNPIIKLAIHKQEWQGIDASLAAILIVWIGFDLYNSTKQSLRS